MPTLKQEELMERQYQILKAVYNSQALNLEPIMIEQVVARNDTRNGYELKRLLKKDLVVALMNGMPVRCRWTRYTITDKGIAEMLRLKNTISTFDKNKRGGYGVLARRRIK